MPRLPDGISVCLFDMDGVLTQTAKVHAAAWKEMFDAYLSDRADRFDEPFREFDAHADYDEFVDGKPRYDGVRSFLASRGIELPQGTPADPPGAETVDGLGNRKNVLVMELIHTRGVESYPGSVLFVEHVRGLGMKTAVVSSSANCEEIMDAAGLAQLMDARVDGHDVEGGGLAGKPAPDTYLAAAEKLGAAPSEAAVFEDALAGVEAGRAGKFGCVVGVNRVGQADALRAHGADLVVDDLAELLPA